MLSWRNCTVLYISVSLNQDCSSLEEKILTATLSPIHVPLHTSPYLPLPGNRVIRLHNYTEMLKTPRRKKLKRKQTDQHTQLVRSAWPLFFGPDMEALSHFPMCKTHQKYPGERDRPTCKNSIVVLLCPMINIGCLLRHMWGHLHWEL